MEEELPEHEGGRCHEFALGLVASSRGDSTRDGFSCKTQPPRLRWHMRVQST